MSAGFDKRIYRIEEEHVSDVHMAGGGPDSTMGLSDSVYQRLLKERII